MKVLVVCKYHSSKEEASACNLINQEGITPIYAWKNTLCKKDLKDIDLVISIGGDGTALSASHYLKNAPLLAVNDSPETSVGALTTITLKELPDKLKQIKEKNYKTEPLERIQVLINNKPIPQIALNDVFIASKKPYLISRYKIKFKEIEESHYSSGLIFSTGTGSTAWFHSAGGIPFSPQEKHIKMIVREPYHGKIHSPSTTSLTINEKEEITIIPLTPSVLAIDSIREYPLSPEDKVTIRISEHPLARVR